MAGTLPGTLLDLIRAGEYLSDNQSLAQFGIEGFLRLPTSICFPQSHTTANPGVRCSRFRPDHGEETENLRVVINQLRKKIEKDAARPRYVLTEPWLGYRFQFPIAASERPARRKS
jgi:hypothetical protein